MWEQAKDTLGSWGALVDRVTGRGDSQAFSTVRAENDPVTSRTEALDLAGPKNSGLRDQAGALYRRMEVLDLASGPMGRMLGRAKQKIKPEDIDVDALMPVIERHLRTVYRIGREQYGELRDSRRG
jgi:hypothetical protein